MRTKEKLPELEYLIMVAIMRLPDQAFGMSIHREITERTGLPVVVGSVYITLARLVKKKFVLKKTLAPTASKFSTGKVVFRLSAAGERVAREYHAARVALEEGVF